MTEKRILFVLTGLKSDGGGMFHSSIAIAEAIAAESPESKVEILQIGTDRIRVFENARLPMNFVILQSGNVVQYVRDLVKFIKAFRPTHIQAFDNRSYFFARLMAIISGARPYLARPGGPNPGVYFPWFADLVVFSAEGHSHFSGRFPARGVHLIPQRVAALDPDEQRVEQLRRLLKADQKVLLRIARIGPYYNRSNLQTFSLAKRLRADGAKIQAVHIGFVEDQASLDELRRAAGPEDVIITDAAFTTQAARLISVADVVLGTGRGLIEAAMLGKPVITPTLQSDLPVLVTEENLEILAATNFSERNNLPNDDPEAAYRDVLDLLVSDTAYGRASAFSTNMLAGRYDVRRGAPTWLALYDKDQKRPSAILSGVDLLLNGLVAARWYVPAIVRKR